MSETAIAWATDVWNPVTGCDQVSEGCGLPLADGTSHGQCYALTLAARLKAMGNRRYQVDGDPRTSGPGFGLTLHADKLEDPLRAKRPRRYFVNSMSDLFHAEIPDEFIARVFATMAAASQHQFLVLTKRPGRMASLLRTRENGFGFPSLVRSFVQADWNAPLSTDPVGMAGWPLRNVWLGVSVENQKWADVRIPLLLNTPAAIHWLSCEPLLGPVDLLGRHTVPAETKDDDGIRLDAGYLRSLDWIVAGGESGPNYLPMDLDWARTLRDQCVATGTPFFYKQGSGPRPEMDRELDGRRWEEYP